MFKEIARDLALQVPAIRRLKDQRDAALREAQALRRPSVADVTLEAIPADRLVHGTTRMLVAYDPAVVSDVVAASIRSGAYEGLEVRPLGQLVHPDDRVVELGAGIGFVAAFVATRCRPASYLAIEADPSLTDLFHRTLALNGIDHGVDHLNKAAIGGGSREARFSREGDFFASHVSEQGGLAVPTVDLNQVIADRQATILIVDIEGGETTLFDELMLDGVRAVCMEIHPQIGTAAVLHLFGVLGDRGFAYDGRLSSGTVVTFMRQISA